MVEQHFRIHLGVFGWAMVATAGSLLAIAAVFAVLFWQVSRETRAWAESYYAAESSLRQCEDARIRAEAKLDEYRWVMQQAKPTR